MPKLWVLRGIKKGILTTKYPKSQPSRQEIPLLSIPPEPTSNSDWNLGTNLCPTGAIKADNENGKHALDLGKCIYCRKCDAAGFRFQDDSVYGSLQAGIGPAVNTENATNQKELGKRRTPNQMFKKSFHVLMIDVGSCNACNLEVSNLGNPYYDFNRLGIFFTNSPKHADALIVVGALNKSMVEILKRAYDSIPNPKLVIAVGACPISGGIFQGTQGFVSPVSEVIPVDVIIPGCPPSPVQILQGLLMAMGKLEREKKQEGRD